MFFTLKDEFARRQAYFMIEIQALFSDHDQKHHMVLDTVFFINSTERNDPEIERLTGRLVQIASKQSTWGQQMPMAWVPLQLQIGRLKSENFHLIAKEKLVEVNRKNEDLSLSKTEFERFLRVQHSLGKIVYFEKPEFQHNRQLDKYVIIQPSALVNVLRSFITDELFWPTEAYLREIHNHLSSHGEISKHDLMELWKQKPFCQFVPDGQIREYMISLLIQLDILVEPKRKDISIVDTFLVPCMVKNVEPTEFLDDVELENKTLCLSFRLLKTVVPTALSFKLIGSALSMWPFKKMKDTMFPSLFYNSAILYVDDNNELRLNVEGNRIVVYLKNKTNIREISPDIAASIQECLTSSLKKALLFYHSNMGKDVKGLDVDKLFEMEVGYACQQSPCLLPLSEVKENSRDLAWKCGRKHDRKYALLWMFDKVG